MIITALTDLHGDTHRLPAIAGDLSASDVVLLTGDLTHFGQRDAADKVVSAVGQYNSRILAVPGNCDYPEVDAYLTERGMNLHGRHEEIDGFVFLGVGGSLPCPETTPNELSEMELDECLWKGAKGMNPNLPLILVSHQPPRRTKCDQVGKDQHVGSRMIRMFIYEAKPMIIFTGHIHEGRAIDKVESTTIVNPGPFGFGGYTLANLSREGIESLEIKG